MHTSWLICLAATALAAAIDTVVPEPGHMSLPNLLTLDDPQKLALGWDLADNIRLDTGRLLIGTGGGSLWLTAGLEGSAKEWTAEMTVRSTGTTDRDLRFRNHNSLSLWFTSTAIHTASGGNAEVFDGIRVVLSNKQTKGLKVFMNDGSGPVNDAEVANSVGSCDFNFLDSSIPFSIRVSYSAAQKWFKVQVDNNLCFKTSRIAIPTAMGDLRFGVSGDIAAQSQEEYELFGLDIWNVLTADAVDDHGFMGDGSLTVEQIHPEKIRQSLMERNNAARKEIAKQNEVSKQNEISTLSGQIDRILAKVERLASDAESRAHDAKLQTINIDTLLKTQAVQQQSLAEIKAELFEFKATITTQFSQMLAAVSKLNERVIGEVREQQYGMEEVSKKVELLMNNHKEIAYQYKLDKETGPTQDDLFDRIVASTKWFLVFICLAVLVLGVFVYRLRHDIKHSKLL